MENEKKLSRTNDLLLANVAWEPTDMRIFPGLLSGLACSTLKVIAFATPPGPEPDETCFFVPDDQMDQLMQFFKRLKRQTGAAFQVNVTAKTLLEGSGWNGTTIQRVFLDDTDSRRLLYLGKDTFVACCDSWDTQMIIETLQKEG